jgi:trehalose 6-phosphate synthase
MSKARPLVLVSNRGPVTFQPGGEMKRGTGGLVTALTGLASHREVLWVASAMTDEDVEHSEQHGGRAFEIESAHGGSTFQVRLVASDPNAYDRFYNVFANPMLWFIQHYLWDLSNAPDIRRNEVEAFEYGYNAVNDDLAEAVVEEIDGVDEPVVMVHDYHLYTLPALVRRARPDAFLHHFIHIPWTQPDAWRVLPRGIRREIFEGLLANDIIGFHTRSYRWNFLQCCRDLMDLEVDFGAGPCGSTTATSGCAPTRCRSTRRRPAASPRRSARRVRETLLKRRRDHLILRVDRADLSKNILRGFSAFDLFLEQHPEFAEKVTFIAQLMPSRTDVAEYAEYLERIEALVAVVNHRTDAGLDADPAQAARRPRGGDGLLQALRRPARQRDVRRHEPRGEGGPARQRARRRLDPVGEHGRHEELGEFALSVNPFDIQETADSIHAALTMSPEERARRMRGLQAHRHPARPRRLDRRPARRHPQEGLGGRPRLSDHSKPNSAGGGAGRPGRPGGLIGAAAAARVAEAGAGGAGAGGAARAVVLVLRARFRGAGRRRSSGGRRGRGSARSRGAGGGGSATGAAAAGGSASAGCSGGSGGGSGAGAAR